MTLVFYLLRKFFPVFFGALMFFVLILGLTDLFINLWSYISKGVALRDVGLIMALYIPKTIWFSVPIAVLFSTAYLLSDFYARNELLAVFACGVSLLKFTVPLLLVSFFMVFGLFAFEDNIVVPTFAKKQKLQQSVLQKEKSLNNDKIVIMSEGGKLIYKADFYDNASQRLFRVYILSRDEENNLESIVHAEGARWNGTFWEMDNAVEYKYSDGELELVDVEQNLAARFVEPPETFRNNTISVEEVNTSEARAYIEHLERAGLPCAEEKSVYYKKYSFPFVLFIVVFMAIGLSGKTRKNVLVISLALSAVSVVCFYITQMITMLMAKFQVIPPLFGAWFPVVIFIFISCVLLKFAKT